MQKFHPKKKKKKKKKSSIPLTFKVENGKRKYIKVGGPTRIFSCCGYEAGWKAQHCKEKT
jgi:outer membrane translocation and assembly module TamA